MTRLDLRMMVCAGLFALCMTTRPGALVAKEEVQPARDSGLKEFILNERQSEIKKLLDEQELLGGDPSADTPGHGIQGTALLGDRPTFAREVEALREALKVPITVNFRDVEMSYVIDFLSRAAGVNIFVSRTVPLNEKKITIRLNEMPLGQALRYILRKRRLAYRIERNAIWVATPEEFENEEVETRVYTLSRGSGYLTEFSQAVAGRIGQAGGAGGLGGAAQVAGTTNIVDILEQAVPFPKGSRLVFDERSGSIIIANTPSNLAVVEEILYELDIEPVQVLIEARFIELDVSDLDEFGIDLQFDSPIVLSKTSLGPDANSSEDHGSRLQANAGTGLNFASLSRAATEGFNFSLAGILTRPRFTFVLNALSETRLSKTLSAPKISTLNHQTATIEVVTEEIYPARFEVAFSRTATQQPAEGEFENLPQEFVTRDVGIVLQVTPHVGADMRMITLTVIPEVSETGTSFTFNGNITLPRFSTRSVATTVMLEDGQTVALGGLLTETDSQSDFRQIPVLSEVPLIGPLFRRDVHSLRRRNLLIFVTASIIKDKVALAQ